MAHDNFSTMITHLKVSNYRSLGENVDLRLSPLTAFVGQNGAGKSNLVDVLRFLADCMRLGLEGAITKRHGIDAVRRWSSGRPFNLTISIGIRQNGISGQYTFVLKGASAAEYSVKREEALSTLEDGSSHHFVRQDGQWQDGPSDLRPRVNSLNLALPLIGGDERFRPLVDFLSRMAVYSIFPDVLREPQKYDPAKPMHEHGGNWVSILKDPSAKKWKSDLLAALGKLADDIEDLEVKSAGGYLIARFKHTAEDRKRAKWFEAAQESDGTLRVAGMLTALLQDASLPVIAIEEPELTVHPGALSMVCDFIRQAAKNSQVVLTTHSPEILDQLTADEVRIVERRRGETAVNMLSEEQRDLTRDHLMSLGEMLRTESLQQALFDE